MKFESKLWSKPDEIECSIILQIIMHEQNEVKLHMNWIWYWHGWHVNWEFKSCIQQNTSIWFSDTLATKKLKYFTLILGYHSNKEAMYYCHIRIHLGILITFHLSKISNRVTCNSLIQALKCWTLTAIILHSHSLITFTVIHTCTYPLLFELKHATL